MTETAVNHVRYRAVAATWPDPLAHDYVLATDGSGHQDGFGGGASIAIETTTGCIERRWCARVGTSVSRAEFEAFLEGLQSILDLRKEKSRDDFHRLKKNPIEVSWITDREDLALSVTRDAQGHINARRCDPDLWMRFSFYEPLFDIHAFWTKRETNSLHNETDRWSSMLREIIKAAYQAEEDSFEV